MLLLLKCNKTRNRYTITIKSGQSEQLVTEIVMIRIKVFCFAIPYFETLTTFHPESVKILLPSASKFSSL